jgi:hypothetical protein
MSRNDLARWVRWQYKERWGSVWRLGVTFAVCALAWWAIAACAGVTPAPSPMADVAPEPQPQILSCGLSGVAGTAFTLQCAEPTATPEPTPTPEPTATATAEPTATPTEAPSFWYLWCQSGDTTCASGRFPVKWDSALTSGGERCALPTGSKVTPKAYMDGYDGVPIAWVVTGADAGGIPCAGWVRQAWLRASN